MKIRNFDEKNNNVNIDKIDNTITKLQGYPSIVVIKEQKEKSNKTSTFQNVSTDKFALIMKKLSTKKALKIDEIPTNVIKKFRIFFG